MKQLIAHYEPFGAYSISDGDIEFRYSMSILPSASSTVVFANLTMLYRYIKGEEDGDIELKAYARDSFGNSHLIYQDGELDAGVLLAALNKTGQNA